jgi:catechol 2,3-dioxygenase-like lactoylglutathione lyase family enzyme
VAAAVPLFTRVDHLVIAVRDLASSTEAYAAMLGVGPSWRGTHPTYGTANALFGLANCYLELLALAGDVPAHPVADAVASYLRAEPEGLFAVAFGSDDVTATAAGLRAAGIGTTDVADGEGRDDGGAIRRWRSCVLSPADTRGVQLIAIEHSPDSALSAARPTGDPAGIVTAVDHVVVFADELEPALALWRDRLGLREAWRREFPERGIANLGLRLGGVTLELAAPMAVTAGASNGTDRLWGVAYRVADCDAAVARLRASGVAVSDARPGVAPRTRVATVKWSERLPTLLLEKRQV